MSEDLVYNSDFIHQYSLFPGTRYMGSKNKIIFNIWDILKDYEFNSFLDVFAGSNVVSYFMKAKGKQVITNDFLSLSYYQSKAIIENSLIKISDKDLEYLLNNPSSANYISKTFKGIYFSDAENAFLDKIRSNIDSLNNEFKKAIAISALNRSCMKKRPRGIFTYTGDRYNDGRQDIIKSIEDHFIENITKLNDAVFDNGKICQSFNEQSLELNKNSDLVYLDPPYFSLKSDNDYVRRYHFVEGLSKYWGGLEIQEHTITKKFKSYPSPFSKRDFVYSAFHNLFEKHKNSILAISYSSNSIPSKQELIDMLLIYKSNVEVHEIDHTYSIGTHSHRVGNKSNRVKEYLFIGK